MPSPAYTFARLREEDLPLARRWLLLPHVRRWWNDDPDEHDYPDGTIGEWLPAIRGEEKAGFRYLKEYREEDTVDPPHVLLDIHRSDLARSAPEH